MMVNFTSIKKILERANLEYGGDITFLSPIHEDSLQSFEKRINWDLPDMFRDFYTNETNGLIIGNRRIYSLYDKKQKKTYVENLERMNDPEKSPWFKGRPHIFNDYVIIGADSETIFCISKKYGIPNPLIYICRNPNSKHGVDLDCLDLDLGGLIETMIRLEYESD